MRLCVPVPCFFKNVDCVTAIHRIKALGFDAAETYNWKNLDLDAVRAACEETGVKYIEIEQDNAADMPCPLGQMKSSIEYLKTMGVQF